MAAKPKRGRGRPAKITWWQIAFIEQATKVVDGDRPKNDRMTVRAACLRLTGKDVAKARALQMAYIRNGRSLTKRLAKTTAALAAALRRKV